MAAEFMFLVVSLLVPAFIMLFNGIHMVEEGHVGIYFRGGALLDEITEPGYHVKLPLVTTVENVQVTV